MSTPEQDPEQLPAPEIRGGDRPSDYMPDPSWDTTGLIEHVLSEDDDE